MPMQRGVSSTALHPALDERSVITLASFGGDGNGSARLAQRQLHRVLGGRPYIVDMRVRRAHLEAASTPPLPRDGLVLRLWSKTARQRPSPGNALVSKLRVVSIPFLCQNRADGCGGLIEALQLWHDADRARPSSALVRMMMASRTRQSTGPVNGFDSQGHVA